MDNIFLSVSVFTAISLLVAAVLLVIRGVAFASLSDPSPTGDAIAIGKLPPQRATASSANLVAGFDSWLDRLVLESGLTISSISAVLTATAAGLVVFAALFLWREDLVIAGSGMLIGMLLVVAYFMWRRRERIRKMRSQLPEVIELMVKAVRAGESLDQAIQLIGGTVGDPLGREFRRCAKHLQVGLSIDAAMRSLSQRVPIDEARLLAVSLTMYRRAGGNLPTTLERLAKVIRDRLAYQGQFRAATAAGRITTIIIAVAGPLVAAYMFIWHRDYIDNFLESTLGIAMLGTAIGLQVIGLVWINRLMDSDY